jgi:High potential iron-sulfur protein
MGETQETTTLLPTAAIARMRRSAEKGDTMHETAVRTTRRMAIARGIRLAGASLLITIGTYKPAAAKTSKTIFLYQNHPRDGKRCGDCKYFSADNGSAATGTCALVDGVIDRDGWCMVYAPRT